MDKNLIIDDDYVQGVGKLCKQRGAELEDILTSYLKILDEIRTEAVMSGDISEALDAYKECVSMISERIETISSLVKDVCEAFIYEVNEADSYLF